MAQKPFIVPIPGMDKLEYVEENLKSLEVDLTADDLQLIDDEFSRISIQGARLNEDLLTLTEEQ